MMGLVGIVQSVSPLRYPVSDATVLLTGAGGEIGGEILKELIQQGAQRIYCLMRGNPHVRSNDIVERIGTKLGINGLPKSVEIISGDVRKPDLGLSPQARKTLVDSVEIVFHCAATTSFLKTRECWDTNFEGLRHIAELLRQCRKRPTIFYFGSTSACGDVCGKCLHEDDYPSSTANYIVPYAASKAAAEQMLASQFPDLDLITIRPSMTVPDTEVTERIACESVWPLQLMKECKALPLNPDARVDLVPLSYVANRTLLLANSERRYRIYHLSAGEVGAVKWSDLINLVSSHFNLPHRVACLQGEEWEKARQSLTRRETIFMRQASVYFPFINQDVRYDNGRLEAEFGPAAIGTFDINRYLPPLLSQVSLADALVQSRHD